MSKKCAVCGVISDSDVPSCPVCGEASFEELTPAKKPTVPPKGGKK